MKWEYRSVQTSAHAVLEFCVDGWELVAVVPLPFGPCVVMAYLKRLKASEGK